MLVAAAAAREGRHAAAAAAVLRVVHPGVVESVRLQADALLLLLPPIHPQMQHDRDHATVEKCEKSRARANRRREGGGSRADDGGGGAPGHRSGAGEIWGLRGRSCAFRFATKRRKKK